MIPKSGISIDHSEKFVEPYPIKPLLKSGVNQRNRGRPWKPQHDDELTLMFCEGKTVHAIAQKLGRTTSAVIARINKLELPVLH